MPSENGTNTPSLLGLIALARATRPELREGVDMSDPAAVAAWIRSLSSLDPHAIEETMAILLHAVARSAMKRSPTPATEEATEPSPP